MERPSSPNVLGAAMTEALVKVVAFVSPTLCTVETVRVNVKKVGD